MSAIIEGQRVRLVPVEPEAMAARFHAWSNHPATKHLIGDTAYPTPLSARAGILREQQEVGPERALFAIEVTEGGANALAGWIRLGEFHAEARRCTVTIVLGEPEYRGRGLGTEAMRLACRFAFAEMGIERVELGVYDFNTRALRSYEKVGFVQEARRRRRVYLEGRYYDEIQMGLLREDFRDESRDAVEATA
ncbi:MAG: GNAT family protein [Dehalococcoidia bacterium]